MINRVPNGKKFNPKVWVYCENLNIGNFVQPFLWVSIYVGWMPFHFRISDFVFWNLWWWRFVTIHHRYFEQGQRFVGKWLKCQKQKKVGQFQMLSVSGSTGTCSSIFHSSMASYWEWWKTAKDFAEPWSTQKKNCETVKNKIELCQKKNICINLSVWWYSRIFVKREE